ncbi:unnamed protein product [Callosobruchus maculatus]|uniref:Uncharacterized protein n=1 Tax=Callosobruchus maculatus TaxID=64391 RepID=A0A653C4T6_CALMS|nr:unnamed protein product [Callosobruchus maculatus]
MGVFGGGGRSACPPLHCICITRLYKNLSPLPPPI